MMVGMVGRIVGDTLQRVDAADPHVEPLVRAELVDGFGVAVGHLTLFRVREKFRAV